MPMIIIVHNNLRSDGYSQEERVIVALRVCMTL